MAADSERVPLRVQRKRMRGFRTPPNTVYVGRPTRWGNPFVVGEALPAVRRELYGATVPRSARESVDLYRLYFARELARCEGVARALSELRGKNLSCWCTLCARHRTGRPYNEPCAECVTCHADVLLELANDLDPDAAIRSRAQRSRTA